MPPWAIASPRLRLRLLYCAALTASTGALYASRHAGACEQSGGSEALSEGRKLPQHASPSQSSYKYLIAGGGVAAASALRELRAHAAPHDRILLVAPSLTAEGGIERLSPAPHETPRSLLQRMGLVGGASAAPPVEVALGQAVQRVDPVARTAALDSGHKVGFEKCLLAFGGDARTAEAYMCERCVAPDARDFCTYVHSCAEKVDELLSTPRGSAAELPHVTVIGGSWAAASFAASVLQRGAAVSVSYAEPAFLARHFPKYVSQELVSRYRYLSDTVEANFDTLSYSALKYVTRTEIPIKYRSMALGYPIRDTEATVHMALVFDAYDLVHFRTDLVVFAPTMMQAPRVLQNAQTDAQGLLVASPELAVYSDVYAAGSCLSDTSGSSRSVAPWSSMRASETGAHAARNMLGGREPYISDIPCFEVTLDPLALRLLCLGQQDGGSETFGFFFRTRDRDATTCGGELVTGVLFYTKSQRVDVEVTGMCIWDGSGDGGGLDREKALAKATKFLKKLGRRPVDTDDDNGETGGSPRDTADNGMNTRSNWIIRGDRQEVEEEMRRFAVDLLVSKHDASGASEEASSDTKKSEEASSMRGATFTSIHRPARTVQMRDREIMFVGDEKLGATTGTSPRDKRSVAFDALLRKSMQH